MIPGPISFLDVICNLSFCVFHTDLKLFHRKFTSMLATSHSMSSSDHENQRCIHLSLLYRLLSVMSFYCLFYLYFIIPKKSQHLMSCATNHDLRSGECIFFYCPKTGQVLPHCAEPNCPCLKPYLALSTKGLTFFLDGCTLFPDMAAEEHQDRVRARPVS